MTVIESDSHGRDTSGHFPFLCLDTNLVFPPRALVFVFAIKTRFFRFSSSLSPKLFPVFVSSYFLLHTLICLCTMAEPSISPTELEPRLVDTILILSERSGLDAAGVAEILRLDVADVQAVLSPPAIDASHDSGVVVSQATGNSALEPGQSGVKRKLSKKEQEKEKKAKREQKKQEARREKERAEEERVNDLNPELCCQHKHVFQDTGELVRCFEDGQFCCAKCHDLLCAAHIFITAETFTAKPVVKKGGKPPEVEFSDHFCMACTREHGIEGKINEFYGVFQHV